MRKRTLYITCDDELYWAFRRYAAGFKSYAEALRDLLRRAGVLREGWTI